MSFPELKTFLHQPLTVRATHHNPWGAASAVEKESPTRKAMMQKAAASQMGEMRMRREDLGEDDRCST